ncbi:MAG: alpha-amylase/4-alpha-glucanotransferase domain-containing protein [Candidatus Omnitrophota bacterium]
MKTNFAIVLHFHQPVGNFDHIIERACERCYVPLLKTLQKYPEIKTNLHFSGCLLEWAEKKKHEIIDLIRVLSRTGQTELMSGGFYEPILPSIPPADRLRQIKMLNGYIRDRFSYDPKGAWIAERVWEPDLAGVLHDAGIKYIVLDDTHFFYAGIPKREIHGYYVTEDNAKTVAVFSSDRFMRYSIPYKAPSVSVNYMRNAAREKPGPMPLFVYGDDGEKFGEWEGMHEWVFKKKWLEKFFDELIRNKGWLSTVKFSEYMRREPPRGRVYFPPASYEEMLEWALPASRQEQFKEMIKELRASGEYEEYGAFIKGAMWRDFFIKYPESNHMNKKMIHVSGKLDMLRAKRKTSPLFVEAEKDLFRAQCNCAYWHGVFGGLYLFHLRSAIYHHLIRSEAGIDKICYGRRHFCKADVLDINADGFDEVLLENREISLCFAPAEGGTLKELDSKTIQHNFTNSLARRIESYHQKIMDLKSLKKQDTEGKAPRNIHDVTGKPGADLIRNLSYDNYGRYGLVDHFFKPGTPLAAFSRCDYEEAGDFVNGAYAFKVKRSIGKIILIMEREAAVGRSMIRLAKRITMHKRGAAFDVRYNLVNSGDKAVKMVFAPEFNVTMPEADSERYSVFTDTGEENHVADTARHDAVETLKIRDTRGQLSFEMVFGEKYGLWQFPVKTVSQSERAYELNYQSSVLLPLVRLNLAPGAAKQIKIGIKLIA